MLRPYPGYSFITDNLNAFKSNYNSLQTSLAHRTHDGTQITANYTWAKALTNANTPQNNADTRQDYDNRH